MPGSNGRESRPDPDALLSAATAEGRGKLKIFLGAAPGVGKTFAMLSAAHQLAREGVIVLVGVVETHGRTETQALVAGLEVLPRQSIEYRGHTMEEFDIDAALQRRPPLIIVDELAHTNAPGSRHPKRYQDVQELLRAGIDVWTALNIQHLDSLSDVVSKMTGVTVRETVPDTVIEKANEVVVVDLTPSELIARLKEGKVYLPDNARRAADNFFKPGNLTALRELALRRTADRVDHQMVEYLRQNAIEGAWPAAERILVCVGADALSESVVRAGSRLAGGLNASWLAITVETGGDALVDPVRQRKIDETLRLAERLGAQTARLTARDLVEEILRFSRRENITQIVIGHSHANWWSRLRGRALPVALMSRASDISVHVVISAQHQPKPWRPAMPSASRTAYGGAAAIVSVAMAVIVGEILHHYLALPNLSMIFLTAVLICAVLLGVWSAIAAALLSFFAYNFFFIEPIYTFTVAEPHELFALLIFLFAAVLTGGLAGRVREQSNAARKSVAALRGLVGFAHKLSGATALEDILYVVAFQSALSVKGQALVLLPKDGELEIRGAYPPEDTLGPAEAAAALWAFKHGEKAGRHSETMPNALYQFWPMRASRGVIGVIGIAPAKQQALSEEDDQAYTALVDQSSVAIERTLLVELASKSEADAERERLKIALLSSISHDLRTPLSSILGSVTGLRQFGAQMPEEARQDLLAAIEEEAGRLSRFVSNLLDMTRVESGNLDLRRDWIEIEEVIAAAVKRARRVFQDREIKFVTGMRAPLIRGDAIFLEQVLFNILDNADKYAPKGTATQVNVGATAAEVVIAIEDKGPGIARQELGRVFEKFYRAHSIDGRPAGTGLGLAIAKGVIEAIGGTIAAESPIIDGRGTRIVIRLPIPKDSTGDFPSK